MTKWDSPQLPLLVHRKTTTLVSTSISEPRRREAALLETAETRNHPEPGHPMLPTLLYALIVPELLAMSPGQQGSTLPQCRRSSSISCCFEALS